MKVEKPGTGDPFRMSADACHDTNFQTLTQYNAASRARHCRSTGILPCSDALIADADVFIQNFRPDF